MVGNMLQLLESALPEMLGALLAALIIFLITRVVRSFFQHEQSSQPTTVASDGRVAKTSTEKETTHGGETRLLKIGPLEIGGLKARGSLRSHYFREEAAANDVGGDFELRLSDGGYVRVGKSPSVSEDDESHGTNDHKDNDL
jgi:hypothetical protein